MSSPPAKKLRVKKDLLGYIIQVGVVQQGDNNKFVDVLMAVGETENVVVKAMAIGVYRSNSNQ